MKYLMKYCLAGIIAFSFLVSGLDATVKGKGGRQKGHYRQKSQHRKKNRYSLPPPTNPAAAGFGRCLSLYKESYLQTHIAKGCSYFKYYKNKQGQYVKAKGWDEKENFSKFPTKNGECKFLEKKYQTLQNMGWRTLAEIGQALNRGYYLTQNKTRFYLTANGNQGGTPVDLRATKVIPVDTPEPKECIDGGKKPFIAVIAESSFDVARQFKGKGKIAVLNFASATQPDGGLLSGMPAQEECLSRGSTLAASLTTTFAYKSFYLENRGGNPLSSEAVFYHRYGADKIIISPNVLVWGNGLGTFFNDPFWVTVITAAAPNMSRKGEASKQKISQLVINLIMCDLIRQVLQSVKNEGCSTVVLGALGCGAYAHNPQIVAKYFDQVINQEGYGSYFDNVLFAIPPGKNKQGFDNLAEFRSVFP